MRYKAEITMQTKDTLMCRDCSFWRCVPIQDEWESSCILTGEDIQAYIYEQRGSVSDMCPFKPIKEQC